MNADGKESEDRHYKENVGRSQGQHGPPAPDLAQAGGKKRQRVIERFSYTNKKCADEKQKEKVVQSERMKERDSHTIKKREKREIKKDREKERYVTQ